jgi:hypothetical protein
VRPDHTRRAYFPNHSTLLSGRGSVWLHALFLSDSAAALVAGTALLSRLAARAFGIGRTTGRVLRAAGEFGRAAVGELHAAFGDRLGRTTAALRSCGHRRTLCAAPVSGGATRLAFGAALLSLLAAGGLCAGLAAGQVRLATREIEGAAVLLPLGLLLLGLLLFWRLLFLWGILLGCNSGKKEPKPEDRTVKQFHQHGTLLLKCRLEIRDDCAKTSADREPFGLKRRAQLVSWRGADQQRQTQRRMRAGGPSGSGEIDATQPGVELLRAHTSQMATGRATIGAADACARFTVKAVSRSQQHLRLGCPGVLPQSDRWASFRSWEALRWQQGRLAAEAGRHTLAQHHPEGRTMPTVETKTTSLSSQNFIAVNCSSRAPGITDVRANYLARISRKIASKVGAGSGTSVGIKLAVWSVDSLGKRGQ